VKEIDWLDRHIKVNVTSDQVKSAPAWDPLAMANEVSEQQLHRHFGWPGTASNWQQGPSGVPEARL
jgi:hypothetical protein